QVEPILRGRSCGPISVLRTGGGERDVSRRGRPSIPASAARDTARRVSLETPVPPAAACRTHHYAALRLPRMAREGERSAGIVITGAWCHLPLSEARLGVLR